MYVRPLFHHHRARSSQAAVPGPWAAAQLAAPLQPRSHPGRPRGAAARRWRRARAGHAALGAGDNLANLYRDRGRYAEAEPFYKRALAIKEKALGPAHPHVATSLENYAALLHKTGRDDEAVKLEARAKAIRARHAEQNPAN